MRLPIITTLCLILGACAGTTTTTLSSFAPPTSGLPTLGIAEMVTLINTDKTLGDHLFSFTSGQDCSTLRSQEGGKYCVPEREYKPVEPQTVYCYQSLGGVNCYTQPLQGANDKMVGTNRANPGPGGQ